MSNPPPDPITLDLSPEECQWAITGLELLIASGHHRDRWINEDLPDETPKLVALAERIRQAMRGSA